MRGSAASQWPRCRQAEPLTDTRHHASNRHVVVADDDMMMIIIIGHHDHAHNDDGGDVQIDDVRARRSGLLCQSHCGNEDDGGKPNQTRERHRGQ